jgi:hypothetical protein
MRNNPFILAPIAFIVTLSVIIYFSTRGSSVQEWEFKLQNPMALTTTEETAYTLDNISGIEKDLTFRCNTKTGEGYFSLKSEELSWKSSHCQDMVGAVKEIEERKKEFALLKVQKIDGQVVYQVQRNQ